MVYKEISRGLGSPIAACLMGFFLDFTQAVSNQPLLLLVIFDGFRWDYLDKFDLPNFKAVASDGVRAGHVVNVMPTLTMASHYTMLTGLYPETHGLVLNDFRDPDHGEYNMYDPSHQTESRWFDTGAEPIWVTNQKAAFNRFSGAMTWPTALAPVMGIAPTYHRGPLYDVSITNRTRIDTTIQWFLHPHRPVNLGLLYFDEPDLIGHHFGTNSIQLRDTLLGLDEELGYLISQLKTYGLFDRVNIIVTSDHGMADVPENQYIDISKFLSRELYEDYIISSVGFIHPKPGKEEEVFNGLKKAQDKYSQLKVHRKTDVLLKALNYSSSNRISPIVLIAEEGWFIINSQDQLINPDRGTHGYPPTVSNMRPFFMAHGPAFKKKYFTESVRSIDFYELMCHLLQLSPAPNNGTFDNIKHILMSDAESYSSVFWSAAAVVTPFLILLGMLHCRENKIEKRAKSSACLNKLL